MKVVSTFPHAVREVENCWIPLEDGHRLAARMWLPDGAEQRPVPAILEYIPYRKRDRMRERDEPMHAYFAGHGYAAVRVDIRGSGDSSGLLTDEYTTQELEDGVAAIRWVATQPWCSGVVGMIGKSWGGFNALQIAALDPPELRAVISVCSTDDRYADDAHYMGGCLLNENLIWASSLFTLNALPPDPEIVGEAWRRMWLERMEQTPLFAEIWMRHQHRDAYWKHGSVCEDYARIQCPVYAVGGWADGYSNAVPRLLAGLPGPRKGLVGPWAHVYPHQGVPRPAIGFLQEALRWWDHWLKGIDTGIVDEPMYRVWMQEAVRPDSFYDARPGRWVAEATWPSPRIDVRRWFMNWRRLEDRPGTATGVPHRSPESVGLAAGSWCGFGIEGEMPTDQREDDGKSLTFDSRPLTDGFEILGAPTVTLACTADRPNALIAVRLNDVSPDGSATRVTYGLLNLTHRNGHEHPEPLEPGRRYTVTIPLNHVAHSFAAGHRLRVALSTGYWPVAWPSPEPVTITVFVGESVVELPIRPPGVDDETLAPFGEPEGAPQPEVLEPDDDGARRTVWKDIATGEIVYRTETDHDESGEPIRSTIVPIDLELGHAVVEEFRITDGNPLSARAAVTHKTEARRGDWRIRVETRTQLSSTATHFCLKAHLDAYHGDDHVFGRVWDRKVRRRLV